MKEPKVEDLPAGRVGGKQLVIGIADWWNELNVEYQALGHWGNTQHDLHEVIEHSSLYMSCDQVIIDEEYIKYLMEIFIENNSLIKWNTKTKYCYNP